LTDTLKVSSLDTSIVPYPKRYSIVEAQGDAGVLIENREGYCNGISTAASRY
jgi:hypothetical protein